MVQLNTILNRMYKALQDARDQCNTQMTRFSKDFAPVPSASTDTMWMGLMTQSIGLLAGVIGSPAEPLLGELISNGILSTLVSSGGGLAAFAMNNVVAAASSKSPADTAQFLGVIAKQMMSSVESYAAAMFKDGRVKWKGGQSTLEDLFGLGNYYSTKDNSDDPGWNTLQTMYQRSLYQQLAVYTWQNLEDKDNKNSFEPYMPFIAYEKGKCGSTSKDLDDKSGFSRDLDRAATQVPRGDFCYYLVQAVDYTNACTTDCTHEFQCTIQNLPGGTHSLLTGKDSVYAGLTLEDFVIPSVEAWLSNGQKTGWKPAGESGPIKGIRDAGATTILVCDYAYNEDNPGKGCPKFDSKCGKF